MTDANKGGSAFPVPESNYISDGTYSNPGMSKRDWFAGQALIGILTRGELGGINGSKGVAKRAYEIADAMLESGK